MSPFFRYSKNQKRGVFFLILLIIGIQLVYFLYNFNNNTELVPEDKEIIRLQKEIDSLKLIANQSKNKTIYPFNPNYITDFKGYQLGMSVDEIDRLLEYRKSGKFVNSAMEFQKVTKISDSLLDSISPYFKFPDWANNKIIKKIDKTEKTTKKQIVITPKPIAKKGLNTATKEQLKKINGIGDKLAERIIKYRKRLGGFSLDQQLYEVYYLEPDVAKRVLENFTVLQPPKIKKLNINTASFKEVLAIPYIDYELTKKIFNYRDLAAEIQDLEELKEIEGFPVKKFDRIALYLEAR
ncbi:MAG: hypothetical protein CR985_02515 [Flavobacteriales bacterium]|nr:MAG: hypothetical protein CR985_02515 [Flavobacteriales bacterium]